LATETRNFSSHLVSPTYLFGVIDLHGRCDASNRHNLTLMITITNRASSNI
jgi:hypothetical protein